MHELYAFALSDAAPNFAGGSLAIGDGRTVYLHDRLDNAAGRILTTSPELANTLRQVEVLDEVEASQEELVADVERLNKEQLAELALDVRLDAEELTKAQIVAALTQGPQAAAAVEPEAAPEPPTPPAPSAQPSTTPSTTPPERTPRASASQAGATTTNTSAGDGDKTSNEGVA